MLIRYRDGMTVTDVSATEITHGYPHLGLIDLQGMASTAIASGATLRDQLREMASEVEARAWSRPKATAELVEAYMAAADALNVLANAGADVELWVGQELADLRALS